ncbi:hypothetical protein [Bradyrhizobium liaoningense]|uniref:hypothetical protein n=1 Tax=Bradyrhizobium liaoningense TaxID=43992 RepID=UPI001BA62BC7|nr:hypothetical protein [Bradyrhizobium liaoningense]MBR0706656.1 hypothetical protein [Bradyrhizobium liaoningense]
MSASHSLDELPFDFGQGGASSHFWIGSKGKAGLFAQEATFFASIRLARAEIDDAIFSLQLPQLERDPGGVDEIVHPLLSPFRTRSGHETWVRRHRGRRVEVVSGETLNTLP